MRCISLLLVIFLCIGCNNTEENKSEPPLINDVNVEKEIMDNRTKVNLADIVVKFNFPSDWSLKEVSDTSFVLQQDTTLCSGFCENMAFVLIQDTTDLEKMLDIFSNKMMSNVDSFKLMNRGDMMLDNGGKGGLVDYMMTVDNVSIGGTYCIIEFYDKKMIITSMGSNIDGGYFNTRIKVIEVLNSLSVGEL